MADATFINQAINQIRAILIKHQPINILEAGCGSASHVKLDFNKRMVGIDIDSSQLENNQELDEKIHGDLQSNLLPKKVFDLVICCDVLEHLARPEDALINMINSLRHGGYLLIACPELHSYKGLLAKYSPHWMRKIIFLALTGKSYRTMLQGPIKKTFFPTYLDPLCSRGNLYAWAKKNGMEVVFDHAYDGHSAGLHRIYFPGIYLARLLSRVIEYVTNGRVDLLKADYCLLLKKIDDSDVN